jgi:hypothetical protein
MNVLGKARRLESTIAARLDQAAKGLVRSRPREPLEIVLAILEAVERRIEPAGRGVRVFPFNRIELAVVAPSREARGRLEAILAGENPLRTRILNRLASDGCAPADVVVEIEYVARAEPHWTVREFDLQFARIAESDGRELDSRPGQIDIRVLCGVMERWAYSLTGPRIDIGRGAEVRDHRNRLIRTNHVVFTEGADAINQTVSRQHAHIAYDSQSGQFRLHDDGSEHGTAIVRAGRAIAVHRGARGVRLQSGDEVVLGEARVRIRLP